MKAQQDEETYALGYDRIDELSRNARSFEAVGGYNTIPKPVGTPDGTRIALEIGVTPGFFKLLGIIPKSGRLLDEGDVKNPVAVISSAFWRDRLHSDPKVIGSSIMVSGLSRTVIGLLPEGIHFPVGTEGPVVFLPISLNAKGGDDLFSDQAIVMARLKPNVSRRQALEETEKHLIPAPERGCGGT